MATGQSTVLESEFQSERMVHMKIDTCSARNEVESYDLLDPSCSSCPLFSIWTNLL